MHPTVGLFPKHEKQHLFSLFAFLNYGKLYIQNILPDSTISGVAPMTA